MNDFGGITKTRTKRSDLDRPYRKRTGKEKKNNAVSKRTSLPK